MKPTHARRLLSHAYLALAAGIVVLCACAGYVVVTQQNARFAADERAAVAEDANHVANALRDKMFAMEMVAERLAARVSGAAPLSDAELSDLTDRLLQEHPEVIMVAVAPGMQVRHVAPPEGNQPLVGVRYWQLPNEFPGVARSFRDRTPVFTGPVQLLDERSAYIMRYPVFETGSRFWGLISIVISEDGLFSDLSPERTYALREVSPAGAPRYHLYGDPAVFEGNPVLQDVSMLAGNWQVGSVPRGGWSLVDPASTRIVAVIAAITMLLVAAVLMIRRFALRSHESFSVLSHAVEALDEGFLLFDKNDRLMLANSSVADFYNVPPGQLEPGITFERFLRGGVERGILRTGDTMAETWIRERVAAHRAAENTVEQLADGRWLTVSEAKTPEGYTVGVRSDVSAQKTAELAAEAANRQKNEFLACATHELRTPLTVIAGHAAFIMKNNALPAAKKLRTYLDAPEIDTDEALRLAGDLSDSIATHGERISGATADMLTMVNNLLDWARAEGNELTIHPEPVSAGDLATQIAEELKHKANAKGVSLMCMCTPARVMADPARLKQVLYNLIGNAIKFTDRGSITVTVRGKGPNVLFAVEDTGCGIARENLDVIFERFHQVDASDTRAFGGLGLGLTMAKQIVEMHGAQLVVKSVLGEGSRFQFEMPKTSAPIPAAPAAPRATPELAES